MYEIILKWGLDALTKLTESGLHYDDNVILEAVKAKNDLVIERFKTAINVTQQIIDLSVDVETSLDQLYDEMGYDTQLTPPQKDKGRDIIAVSSKLGKSEHLLIECKRYTNPVGVEIARALLGVVADEKVNKGVIVTTSRFTRGAKKLAQSNPRLELIPGEQLVLLFNEHFGPKWPLHIDRIVLTSQKANQ